MKKMKDYYLIKVLNDDDDDDDEEDCIRLSRSSVLEAARLAAIDAAADLEKEE
ncbi:hypothetical protein [Xanthomonas albilineans]|uniref:hypothetical protein n=1 Tax=Xanthomonas albilineans TaxID=29447 RepID=UPI000B118D3B|nr:hypothetical protein [Xanthomonas albilineans]